jgi:hypothetical protein
MTQSPLVRLAGPIAVLAGVLTCVAQVGMFMTLDIGDRGASLSNPLFVASMATYSLALCVLLLALVATYEAQSQRAGWFGLVGFGAAFAGTTFLAGNHWFDTFAGPWIADTAPELLSAPVQHPVLTSAALASYALFAVGWVLYGAASARAGVYPAASAIAIVVGGAVGFLALSAPFGIPLGLAVGALGAWITWRSPHPVAAPRPAAASGELSG